MTKDQYADAQRRREEAAAEMAQHELENRQRLRRTMRDALAPFREGVAGVEVLVLAIEIAATLRRPSRMTSLPSLSGGGKIEVNVVTILDADPFGEGQ